MANTEINTVEYGLVSGHISWTCTSEERQLADILLSVHINGNTDLSQVDRDTPNGCIPVLLEQVEEGSPCVVTLCCDPQRPALISSLLVVSEARTAEVYSLSGDYCGTCRGQREPSTQQHSADRGPFYRKHLALECPSTACEVKLLSLGGRASVAVVRVVLGLRPLEPADSSAHSLGLGLGQSIDMERVQSMVQEMGTSLSPGAQSLMDMVQFQQKNQTGMLGGFLPLFMGSGALSALARGATGPPGAASIMTQPPGSTRPTDPSQLSQNRALSGGESDSGASSYVSQDGALQPNESPALHPLTQKTSTGSTGPASSGSHSNHARLADMMSPFLTGLPGQGRGGGCLGPLNPDLLPVLQSVCGQVTQLRIDDAAREEERKASGPREEPSCCRALEEMMGRRLEQMEARLKEHLDQRLDALELRLQTALLQALPLGTLGQQAQTSQAPPDHTHPVQAQTRPLNGL